MTEPTHTSHSARAQFVSGRTVENLIVKGHLDLSRLTNLETLPEVLEADSLDLSHCTSLKKLPARLHVRRLVVNGCTALEALPTGLKCSEVDARNTALRTLPADLSVKFRLNLENCTELVTLPAGLKVGSLIVRGCTALESLPEKLDVCFLDISGCVKLTRFPVSGQVRFGHLLARGCVQLASLPGWLTDLSQLDVRDCANLTQLPGALRVSSWLEMAGSGLQFLPMTMQDVQLRWRGVPISRQIAFQPETIAPQSILDEPNAELRRVMLERVGYEAFLKQTTYQVLDRDRDAGGERNLLRVEFADDEPLVCVSVFCPSTGRQYLIRVPPAMQTCHQAVAWIAGFTNPNEYHPLLET
ncbi:MAG: hypothetical protein K1Y36_26870 [Blastocatellia bacterium]|nr:hypothetical protein [Blastocatellia bacterium]